MRRPTIEVRVLLALTALLVIGGVAALVTVGGSASSPTARGLVRNGEFHADGLLSPPRPAPPLALRNYMGQPVDIASYRGRAVLVTFLYTSCPDVCPLIASNLRVA